MVEKTVNELDIWEGVITPKGCDMSNSEANAILRWEFDEAAKQRMEELATRNGQGTLTETEREELDAYVQVGQVVGILQAKARISLKNSGGNGAK